MPAGMRRTCPRRRRAQFDGLGRIRPARKTQPVAEHHLRCTTNHTTGDATTITLPIQNARERSPPRRASITPIATHAMNAITQPS